MRSGASPRPPGISRALGARGTHTGAGGARPVGAHRHAQYFLTISPPPALRNPGPV